MKKLFILGFALLAVASMAFAGDYHKGTTLACEECHVMHASQTHGYNANGSGITVPLGPVTHFLLRDHINELCLNCHDGASFAPDVLHENGGTVPTNGRQAGALNEGNQTPYFDATGHTLNSTATAPGGTWSNPDGMNCIDCHHQHGKGGPQNQNLWRNVRVIDTLLHGQPYLDYSVGTPDVTKAALEGVASGANHYDITNVNFYEPNTTKSAYGNYCKQCHTNFHGSSTDANMRNTAAATQTEWYRHPAADANIGAVGGGHSALSQFSSNLYRTQVMSATGNWGSYGVALTGASPDMTPSCMTCHKAHGNKKAFGLIFATGTTNFGEGDGDALANNYKYTCGQCHRQGPVAP